MMSVPSEAVGAIKGLKGSKIRDPEAIFKTSIEVNQTGNLCPSSPSKLTAPNYEDAPQEVKMFNCKTFLRK